MEKKLETNQIKMSDLDLKAIKDIALVLFRNNAPDPGKAEHFLTECWVESIVGELNRLGHTSLDIKKDHEHLIKG